MNYTKVPVKFNSIEDQNINDYDYYVKIKL